VATAIVTKYSVANTVPPDGALLGGELAYSFISNTLFIGTETGGYQAIGGNSYTEIIDTASTSATPSSLVFRDIQGNFSANTITARVFSGYVDGGAETANGLFSYINVNVTGDATGEVATNFANDVTLSITLENSGVVAGSYGNTTNIPLITVNEKGLITGVTNVSVASSEGSQAAFDTANSATVLAQSAYDAANSSTPEFNQTAFSHANSAFDVANAAVVLAETPSDVVNTAIYLALDAWRTANAAFETANADNFTGTTANAAFDKANAVGIFSQASYDIANIALLFANSSLGLATNTASLVTNSQQIAALAETSALSAGSHANAAYRHANSAFADANSRLSISGGTVNGNVYITGNLVVTGQTTYVSSNQLNIGDNILVLNADLTQSSLPTENAGIEVERGLSTNTRLIWNESIDKWQ
jgi:hypothetical protein